MEKNRKIIIVVTVLALFLSCVAGTIYYFTEIKLDENGFNSHGIRELNENRKNNWCDIELGTYILEITKRYSSKYDVSVREKTINDYYSDKLKDFYLPTYAGNIPFGNDYYREIDGERYSEDEIDEAIKLECENEHFFEWRDNYIFNNVTIYFRFYFESSSEEYATISISLNKDGTMESSNVSINEDYIEEIFDKHIKNYSDKKVNIQLYLNDGSLSNNYEVVYIHGSVERK